MIPERLPKSKCINCGYVTDCATNPFAKAEAPTPGAISICFKCGAVMAFAKDLTLRGLNSDEIDRILKDPDLLEFLALMTRTIRLFNATKN